MNACLVPRLQNSAGEGNTRKNLSLPVKKVEKSRTVFFGGKEGGGTWLRLQPANPAPAHSLNLRPSRSLCFLRCNLPVPVIYRL